MGIVLGEMRLSGSRRIHGSHDLKSEEGLGRLKTQWEGEGREGGGGEVDCLRFGRWEGGLWAIEALLL